MRIAIATEFVAPEGESFFGGVDSRTIHLGKELSRRNEVHIFTSRQPGQDRLESYGDIQIHRLGKPKSFVQRGNFLSRLKFNQECVKEIASIEPDVVEGSGFVSYLGSYLSGVEAGSPKMVTVHEVWHGEWRQNMGILNGAIGSILEREYLKNPFDKYIAVSEFTRRKLIDLGIEPHKTCVVKNGIDLDMFQRTTVDERYETPTIITVCRLVPYKKVDLLFRAVASLRHKYPDIRLLVIGKGPEETKLRLLAEELSILNNVKFVGKIALMRDLIGMIKRSHAFALPSIVEGFGMAVVEAMAAGTPYVASDIPPIREATGGGLGGRLFKPLDLQDLVRQLDNVLEKGIEPDPRINKLLEEYDWSNIARQYENEIRHLVADRGERATTKSARLPASEV